MKKHWTEAELNSALNDLAIVTDTREQKNGHIVNYFRDKDVKVISRALDVGDYSAQLGEITFETDFAVERKHNLDEICGNFTAERQRFEREFLRAKANGTKVFLIIENATWTDVFMGNYRSRLSSKALVASLLSWQVKYDITVIFCSQEDTPKLIRSLLWYSAREQLLKGM